MTLKVCFVCDQMKDTTEFTKDRSKLDGLHPNCKPCLNAKKWLMRRRKGIPEKPVFVDSDTHKTCRQCHTQIPVADFGRHPSQCKECMALRSRAYRRTYPDRVRESYQRWATDQQLDYFTVRAKRRREASEYGRWLVTDKDLTSLLRRQHNECPLCHSVLDATKHLDHIVPISRGGKHRIGNLQWLCRLCNLRKHSKFLSELRLAGKEVV